MASGAGVVSLLRESRALAIGSRRASRFVSGNSLVRSTATMCSSALVARSRSTTGTAVSQTIATRAS
jgi:hypothetical protein